VQGIQSPVIVRQRWAPDVRRTGFYATRRSASRLPFCMTGVSRGGQILPMMGNISPLQLNVSPPSGLRRLLQASGSWPWCLRPERSSTRARYLQPPERSIASIIGREFCLSTCGPCDCAQAIGILASWLSPGLEGLFIDPVLHPDDLHSFKALCAKVRQNEEQVLGPGPGAVVVGGPSAPRRTRTL
jgi:hypothetical protein